MCFRLSIWPNGHRESQKYEFANWIPRTNEVTGLIVCLQVQLKIKLDSVRVAYSVPEVHELVVQRWYPRRWSCLERIPPVPITLDDELLWRNCLACPNWKRRAVGTVLFKTSRAAIFRSILVPRDTWFYNTQTHITVQGVFYPSKTTFD
jgi:hypothetical protein